MLRAWFFGASRACSLAKDDHPREHYMPVGEGICRREAGKYGGRLYKDVAIRPTFPIHKTNLRIFKTRFSFRCLPEKRNGSWTPKRKER